MKRDPKRIPHPEQCPHCYSWDKRLYSQEGRAYINRSTQERKFIAVDVWECSVCGVRWQIARERAGDDWEPEWRH